MGRKIEPDHWLVQRTTIRRLWIGFLCVLALTVLVELAVEHHAKFAGVGWLGFNAVYGFVSCVVLVVFAKVLGAFLKRPDAYYDD